jgi:hypothetical protein
VICSRLVANDNGALLKGSNHCASSIASNTGASALVVLLADSRPAAIKR